MFSFGGIYMQLCFISVWEVDWYIENEEYILIDVRTPQEFAEGHLYGAKNLPFINGEQWANIKYKNKIPVFYCSRGSLSLKAAIETVKTGRQAVNVSGGIAYYCGPNWIRMD